MYSNKDTGTDHYEEDEFYAHDAGKAFEAECKKRGVDLTGWEYGEATIDPEPYDYGFGKPPFRNATIYYGHPTDEDVSLTAEIDDASGAWVVTDFEISRD